jgi:hypothetical protein
LREIVPAFMGGVQQSANEGANLRFQPRAVSAVRLSAAVITGGSGAAADRRLVQLSGS